MESRGVFSIKKNNTTFTRTPTKKSLAQQTHVIASIIVFCKLKKIKKKN